MTAAEAIGGLFLGFIGVYRILVTATGITPFFTVVASCTIADVKVRAVVGGFGARKD